MIPELRQEFNRHFTARKYQRFRELLDARVGTPIQFRCCETPFFFPRAVFNAMAGAGAELVSQLAGNPEYLAAAASAIPPGYRTAGERGKPVFIQADFGLVREADGSLAPKLVEIQGFPSLYAFQLPLAASYREAFELPDSLRALPSGLTCPEYDALMIDALRNGHEPEEVVLTEIDPLHQKTLPDFLETERRYAVRTVDIRELRRRGDRLFYDRGGREIRIRRIYNRAIADELIRRDVRLPFSFSDDLDVEWAGHPDWFFLISKFSLPWLRHPSVPRTWFLDRMEAIPEDLDRFVLKPLYSFAGLGVVIGPTRQELDAVPAALRGNYILQERMDFVPVVETPFGPTKAEIRIMYLWLDRLYACNTIIRMGRGKMMGVDHNRDLEWVGASCAFFD